MARVAGLRARAQRAGARAAVAHGARRAGDRNGVELPFTATTPYVNTIPPDKQPRYPGNRELERRIKSFVRWNAMAMVTRANRDFAGIGGHISTYASSATLYEVALQSLLPRPRRERLRRRPGLFPGPRLARHVRPGVSRRPAHRAESDQLPPRAAAGRRAVVVSASVADARVLGVPHGLDGPRADHGDLPGPVQSLSHRPRHRRPVEEARVGVPGRRRMRRAGIARRHHARLARAARQPDLRHQLQSAAARRPGARQRQDHPGAGRRVPRRRLERHQGHLGRRLGSAVGEGRTRACCSSG